MIVGKLKYEMGKEHASTPPEAVAASDSNKFELRNNSLTPANHIIHGEVRQINSQNKFNVLSAKSANNPVQVSSASKIKDDLFSHNQFNYHNSNLITQKLPNIEYFNYLENSNYTTNRIGVMQNEVNVGMSGLIDLSKDPTFVRNGDRLNTKMPANISNFNF